MVRGLTVFFLLFAALAGTAHAAADPLRSMQPWLDGTAVKGAAGGRGVVVAIVDSGVDLHHPDLRRNLWRNPGEIAANGIDDDRNGYVDDVQGWDVVDGDADPQDLNGHGTHVAGVVGAVAGNGRGGRGVAPRATLMPVRVLDRANGGTLPGVAEGLRYAVANGADVVNLSLNAPQEDADLERALEEAAAAGVLVVTSAGNLGEDLGTTPSYPACSASGAVLAVESTGLGGRLSSFSNHGACVGAKAVGEDVVSTALGGGYEQRSGTSQAAPQLAGRAALLIAARRVSDLAGLTAALRSRP